MPNQKMLMLIATFLVAIGLIGALFTFSTSGATTEKEQTEVIQNADITDIWVKSENATMNIVSTTDDQITLVFTAPESKHHLYELAIEENEESLAIELKEKFLQFISLDLSLSSPQITLYLPEKDYDVLELNGVNGKMVVRDATITDINVKNVNGRIQLTDLEAENTSVASDNGSISIENVTGQITTDVTNGSTALITDDLDRFIDLASVNGRINVQTKEKPTNATIEVDVKNGKVDIFGHDTRHSSFGDGKNLIKLETVNGGIKVE